MEYKLSAGWYVWFPGGALEGGWETKQEALEFVKLEVQGQCRLVYLGLFRNIPEGRHLSNVQEPCDHPQR